MISSHVYAKENGKCYKGPTLINKCWTDEETVNWHTVYCYNSQCYPFSAVLYIFRFACLWQPPPPSSCWWRTPSWWTRARRSPWCASPQVESRPPFSPGSAVMTAYHKGAWWRGARSHSQPSPQTRRGSTAAWPATVWETRPRSPPLSWSEVRKHDCMAKYNEH